MLIDTHAHIQVDEFCDDVVDVLARAKAAGVGKIVCVGEDEIDSVAAVELAGRTDGVWATVGLHPHYADRGQKALDVVASLAAAPKVVGIGECGLDYFRSATSHEDQERALRFQIELGLEHDLAMVFHVRDAFGDFFRILDDYQNVRGVVHCFTAGVEEMRGSVDRGLYVALNGIMTFTKDERQLDAARELPLSRLVLETDCPYLAPAPKRGGRNEPANLVLTAEFLATLRGESIEQLTAATTRNAQELFRI